MFDGDQSEISIGAGRESSKAQNAHQSRLRMKPGLA